MEDEIYNLPITIRKQHTGFVGKAQDITDFKIVLKERGVEGFNSWARENDRYGLDLRGIRLSNLDLHGINLRKARLDGAVLFRVIFDGAILAGISADNSIVKETSFKEAFLMDAFFQDCHFTGGSFEGAHLYGAHFKGTRLKGVDVSYANLSGVDFRGSVLHDVVVTGTNTWGINTDPDTVQKDLKIIPFRFPFEDVVYGDIDINDEIILTCNDIEVAQLLFLLTRRNKEKRSEKVKKVTDALTDKIVLILGNFRRSEKSVLYAIRDRVGHLNYVPVIFDFSVPRNRDMIETVTILAGLSRFVIADFTSQSSTPLEALLIISQYKVPFMPIVRKGQAPFAMFSALKQKYNWVLDLWEYKNKDHLMKALKSKVIGPCEKKCKEYDDRRKEIEKELLRKSKRKHWQ